MPTSTEIQAQVRVVLYPEPDSTQAWPCPPGVSIQLRKKGVGSSKLSPWDLVTGAGGVTAPTLLEVGSYKVNITDPKFQLWTSPDLNVPAPAEKVLGIGVAEGRTGEGVIAVVAEAEEPLDVLLFPQGERRLVVVRLVNQDGDYLAEGTMNITASGGPTETFTACEDNNIYAAAPKGAVRFEFASAPINGVLYCPQASVVPYTVSDAQEVKPLEFIFWPAIQIVATPAIVQPDGYTVPLTGTSVAVEYQVSDQDAATSRTKVLPAGATEICFEYPFPGQYLVTVTPPAEWENLPVQAAPPPVTAQPLPSGQWTPLSPGSPWEVPAVFAVVPTQDVTISVQPPPGLPLTEDATFVVSYGTGSVPVPVSYLTNQGPATVPQDGTLTIGVAEGTTLQSGSVPLQMAIPDQPVTPGINQVQLIPAHSLTISAVNAVNQPVSGAMIDVFRPDLTLFVTVITDQTGTAVVGLPGRGTYYVADHYENGQVGVRQSVEVASHPKFTHRVGTRPADGEALTDLSAYPVLTEEISTTGAPGPAAGAPGGGGPGAGYGQAVDQVMRDVLGWRPSGDVAGFRAALTGAFQLRQVEGHTEWTWQQRGYAVQADMGALTGAQASIYARAKSALDQMLPLLAGLTAINPALYPPQDLEAIRTIITAELGELVSELALEGGPRIERVDQLFLLLVGESRKSFDPNPDHVQGQLGKLRDRFGLSEQWVDTVDEERILTNFRVVVEQVLSLRESWFYDRDLLTVVDSRTSLGTLLILLSRGLEAVCESVSDLTFALDSVYVDAAQRQVIELRLPGQPPVLLSDLLDWVVRASRDEGPRIIQDAGKDGVLAFAPVLAKLRTLIHAARELARSNTKLPSGMKTPRVDRAFQVLVSQLAEAARLAKLVQRDQPPQLDVALARPYPDSSGVPTIMVDMFGSNLRKNASVVLIPENREGLADLPGRFLNLQPPSFATATFRDPRSVRGGAGVNWLVSFINEDGEPADPIALTFQFGQ
jgi:hypothetical protein